MELEDLARNPYPFYAACREQAPLVWVPGLGMWMATRYEDVRDIIMDTARFTTVSDHSIIQRTFGTQMLTSEGADQRRYRRALQPIFMPPNIRQRLETEIDAATVALIAGFAAAGRVELRSALASRLPIQTILLCFGLDIAAEPRLRAWYDSFEAALANFGRDPDIEARAQANVAELHDYLAGEMAAARAGTGSSVLAEILSSEAARALDDEEIRRNLSIIFFGGISTVEALILNSLWALSQHPLIFDHVRADPGLIPRVLDETMRWLGPVQSATRHVVTDTIYKGIALPEGAIVNCMLAAANHDPSVFPEPACFNINRRNPSAHLGFATGAHLCLGFRLAQAEARIALARLLEMLPSLSVDNDATTPPEGYEFRQPRQLTLSWRVP